ncbi:unnamed protein product, partial [Polarella glacialis]
GAAAAARPSSVSAASPGPSGRGRRVGAMRPEPFPSQVSANAAASQKPPPKEVEVEASEPAPGLSEPTTGLSPSLPKSEQPEAADLQLEVDRAEGAAHVEPAHRLEVYEEPALPSSSSALPLLPPAAPASDALRE